MKELDIKGMDNTAIESFTSEICLLESIPYHKNLVRYLYHYGDESKIRVRWFR
jgi:hypothetical protein